MDDQLVSIGLTGYISKISACSCGLFYVRLMESHRAARDEPFALARWGVILLTGVWSVLALNWAVAPGSGWLLSGGVLLGGWLVIATVWLGTVVAVAPRRLTAVVVVPPLAVIATISLIVAGIPRYAGFVVHEAELAAYARSISAGTVSGGERRIGPFTVRDPKRLAGGARFTLADGGGILLEEGYAFLPHGDTGDLDVTTSVHLFGPWHHWTIDYD